MLRVFVKTFKKGILFELLEHKTGIEALGNHL
jgi:hypothetical protein